MDFTLEFATNTEAMAHLAALDYFRLPTKGLTYTHAAHGWDDHGRRIMTFARKCYSAAGEPVRWHFAEQAKR